MKPTVPASSPAPAADAPVAAPPPAAAPAGLLQRLSAYRLLWSVSAAVLIADQLSKYWVTNHVPFNPTHLHDGWRDLTIIKGFFYLIHVGNTGAAWSMFSGRSAVLGLLSAATLFAIFHWRRALGLRDRFAQLSFGLLCGGIAGNGIDRVVHQHVIDFLDFHFGSYVYPTFNIADSGICVGVVLYLWHSLREK